METRIYIVSEESRDGALYSYTKHDIFNMTTEEFIEEAESQGNVWSSWRHFQKSFNEGVVPMSDNSVMRVFNK